MSDLQKPLEKTDVRLVSFSVDPEKDTPQVLRSYAERLQAEPGRWDFLTGPKSAIYKLSHDGFKLAVSDGSDAQGIPVHSTRMGWWIDTVKSAAITMRPSRGGDQTARRHKPSSARATEVINTGSTSESGIVTLSQARSRTLSPTPDSIEMFRALT